MEKKRKPFSPVKHSQAGAKGQNRKEQEILHRRFKSYQALSAKVRTEKEEKRTEKEEKVIQQNFKPFQAFTSM